MTELTGVEGENHWKQEEERKEGKKEHRIQKGERDRETESNM